jgi:hypothetical protein
MSSQTCLQVCGHDSFCFGCIQGLQVCPICDKGIAGWAPIGQKSTVNPLLSTLGGASDVALDPLIARSSKSASKGASHNKLKEFPIVAAVEDIDAVEEAAYSDDEPEGLVHWCGNDIFKEGGVRSVLPGPEEEHLEPEVKKPIQPTKAGVEAMRTSGRLSSKATVAAATTIKVVEDQVVAPKRKRSNLDKDDRSLNHTRIVEKPLNEILSAAPLVSNVEKPLRMGTEDTNTSVPKKKPGCPPEGVKAKSSTSEAQKSVSRTTQGRQAIVPLRFR